MEIDSEMFEIYSRAKAELGDLYKIRFEYDRFDINVKMKCYTGKGSQVRRWSTPTTGTAAVWTSSKINRGWRRVFRPLGGRRIFKGLASPSFLCGGQPEL